MSNDRGTIKWTSLMLPEHVELLKQMWQEDKRERQPIMDPQEIELINQQVVESYENQIVILLTYYQNGRRHDAIGRISKLHPQTKKISLKTADSCLEISFSSILSISVR
ncbi:YolD-like family protein [Virgibacillus necropolis]|uniref:YolD-like family protein n=1 Tax=Virgibacillus necropolis TaxID=163877 RepID=UPI00384EA900